MIRNITVIVPTKNEEKNLSSCLSSIREFEHVIVVDSNSSDKTPQITLEFSRTLVQFNWNGQFPKKRNWALFNLDIRTDWVLFLDADEVLTPNIIEEMQKINDEYVGYWLNYDNFFLRRPLKFGVPQRKLALFNKNFGCYEGTAVEPGSKLDMEIHEHPILKGKIGSLRGRIIHNDYQGYYKFRHRHLEYARWEAERLRSIRNHEVELKLLTPRQKVKYRLMGSCFFAPSYFFYAYIFRLGFLDGLHGFLYALEKMNYFTTIYMLTREEE